MRPLKQLISALVLATATSFVTACVPLETYKGIDPKIERDPVALETACNDGVGVACSQLGQLYRRGKLVAQRDPARSVIYYRRACELGHADGCLNAGWMLGSGAYKVAKEPERADSLLERSCALGGSCWTTRYSEGGAARLAASTPKDTTKKKGGFLKGALGAAGGFAAAKALGASDDDAVAAAAVGIGITNPESEAATAAAEKGLQQLSASAEASAGARAASANTSSARGAAGTGHTGATLPNRATSSCRGFTMQNYRQKALDKSGDVQLNTQCGLAFEYYKAYTNAIAQGYGAADVQRTYNAHVAAAKVADDVYRNMR